MPAALVRCPSFLRFIRDYNVPGRPVISNCGTPTEKMSEFLDQHVQPNMKGGKSYVKDTYHFLGKLKQLGKEPPNAILVTADVVSLYPSIPNDAGLKALYEKLEERNDINQSISQKLFMTRK